MGFPSHPCGWFSIRVSLATAYVIIFYSTVYASFSEISHKFYNTVINQVIMKWPTFRRFVGTGEGIKLKHIQSLSIASIQCFTQ
jgi:hypothetical protein